ncbi:MAG: hypothetical protein ACR2NR_04460 [Solirubrobacteraceae bacterium]
MEVKARLGEPVVSSGPWNPLQAWSLAAVARHAAPTYFHSVRENRGSVVTDREAVGALA